MCGEPGACRIEACEGDGDQILNGSQHQCGSQSQAASSRCTSRTCGAGLESPSSGTDLRKWGAVWPSHMTFTIRQRPHLSAGMRNEHWCQHRHTYTKHHNSQAMATVAAAVTGTENSEGPVHPAQRNGKQLRCVDPLQHAYKILLFQRLYRQFKDLICRLGPQVYLFCYSFSCLWRWIFSSFIFSIFFSQLQVSQVLHVLLNSTLAASCSAFLIIRLLIFPNLHLTSSLTFWVGYLLLYWKTLSLEQ